MSTEDGLRRIMLALSAAIAGGVIVELLLAEHTESLVQAVPFVLCGLAIVALALAAAVPGRRVVRALRVVLALCALGGAFGVFEHVEHNAAFAKEIDAAVGGVELLTEALFGANPLLAPGALTILALLGLGATWRHPALAPPADM